MTDVTVTVRMPKELRVRLEALGVSTQRSKSFLAKEAISRFVETEAEIVEGIKRAQEEIAAGLAIPHDEAMKAVRATILAAAKRSKA